MADLTQIGIGGALALLILERVFSFLRAFNSQGHQDSSTNGKSGNQPISFWERRFEQAAYESAQRAVKECVPIIVKDCLRDHDEKVRRPDLESAEEQRQEIRQQIDELKRQVALSIAEIARLVRDR